MSSKKASFSFEQSLDALETTVEQLESGDLTLEDALQAFEKGISLTRECQQALNQAQKRINVLLEKNGELVEQPLNTADTNQAKVESATEDDFDASEDIPF